MSVMAGTLSVSGGLHSVRRIVLPDRLERGNTSVVPLSPIDRAAWIAPPETTLPSGGGFYRFRCEFESVEKSRLIFHVSADERFVLMLDNAEIARGPDRGDPNMWFYQSYATVLGKGVHVVDAIVWKLNPGQAPNAQLTWRLGFVFAAEGVYDKVLSTGKALWKVGSLSGTIMTRGKYPFGPVGAQCDVSGTGFLWEIPAVWRDPIVVRQPIERTDYGSERKPGWLLYPSQLPAQCSNRISPGRCVAADNLAFVTNGIYSAEADEWGSNAVFCAASTQDPRCREFDALLQESRPLTIPSNTSVRFLWNLGDYYCAYPELKTQGGRSATVSWGWAESLYEGDCFDWHTVVTNKVRKGMGNRNDIVGKYFYGINDLFHSDGRSLGRFTTPWWRSGLFCILEVKTEEDPLTLTGISLTETRYPFDPEAYFHCDDSSIDAIQRICLRGLQMCMHDMYFDCPYHEQQMYGADARLQMMMSQVLSADDSLNRQAFRLFEVSQRDNGLVSMNYPTTWLQESVSFSQYWGMMLGDFAMWRNNSDWLRARMPAVRRMLFGLESYLNSNGLQVGTPGWHFVDWVPEWNEGTAPGHGLDESSIDSLLYLLALQKGCAAEKAIGELELANRWGRLAKTTASHIIERFWDDCRGMVADTVAMDVYSEHAQALAILTDILSPERKKRVMLALAEERRLARCTASFSSYLFEAYFKCGRADLFFRKLDAWREYVRMGLKTPLEGPGDARSDCHGWSSNPLYHLHSGVAGVNPSGSHFRTVRISPCPGHLKWIKAKTSTPKGFVVQDLRFDGRGVSGEVTLPNGLTGEFVWHEKTRDLHEGRNVFLIAE